MEKLQGGFVAGAEGRERGQRLLDSASGGDNDAPMAESFWSRALSWLVGGRTAASAVPVWIESPLGRANGSPTAPLVLFGNVAGRALGDVVAGHSTLRCVLIPTYELLAPLLEEHDVAGMIAHSRPEHPGEAGRAIGELRRLRPRAAAIYNAWDYHVGRGAQRALEYGADGVLMPAIDVNDLFRFVFGVLGRVGAGAPPPATVEEHVALVREFAGGSPFWELQDRVVSRYF